jgi:hypothetical protein
MVDAATRNLVRQRADDRCEYCQLPQAAVEATFHVEHIIAKQHMEDYDSPLNLAWACDRCNVNKGTNLSSVDPQTGSIVQLFHPRNDAWHRHFAFMGGKIIGLTAGGRATARLLKMNAPRRVRLREDLLKEGRL